MNNSAAGIIPYTIIENQFYFLLGLEKNKWSGFVGGYEEKDNSITETATREFNEETAMIFSEYPIKLTSPPLIDFSPSGRNVYMWFIEFPTSLFKDNYPEFEENKKKYTAWEYNEKSAIKWFSLDEVKTRKDIFYLCRKRIKNTFLPHPSFELSSPRSL